MDKPRELAMEIARILDNKGGMNIQILQVDHLTSITDYFVIASARNVQAVRALAEDVDDKLMEKGIDGETAAHCSQWLSERGLMDDESYAQALGRHYAAKGYGPGRLKAELSKRGIDRELWEDTLESMPVSQQKIDKFISARLKDPSDREQLRKVSAALLRRGHSWDEIRSALERFNAEAEYAEYIE